MAETNTIGRTIQLFLVDGEPGLRKVTLHSWTGCVFVANDVNFAKMTERDEVKRTGRLYPAQFRQHDGPDKRSYIGSSYDVSKRIKAKCQRT